MSRSFLAAIRAAIFPHPDQINATSTIGAEPAATQIAQPAPVPVASAPVLSAPTHPAAVVDTQGRFAEVAQAEGIAGNPKRLAAALELAATAPEMSTVAVIEWTNSFVPAADAPKRTFPTLAEREDEAQRMVDALGASSDAVGHGWDAAIAEAHRRHRIN